MDKSLENIYLVIDKEMESLFKYNKINNNIILVEKYYNNIHISQTYIPKEIIVNIKYILSLLNLIKLDYQLNIEHELNSLIESFNILKDYFVRIPEFVICIDNIFFKLVYKFDFDLKYSNLVYIHSANNISFENPIGFCVYQSNSELNMYRLAAYFNKKFYKGEKNEGELETDMDYIQQTFIHIKLQKFIIDNINHIPFKICNGTIDAPYPLELNKLMNLFPIMDNINNTERKIKKGFFYEYNSISDNLCGNNNLLYNKLYGNLQTFSEKFKNSYDIISNDFLYNYENIKINENRTLNTKYKWELYSVILHKKKEITEDLPNEIILYYLIVDFCELLNISQEIPIDYDYDECPYKKYHLPLFLTENDAKITEYGIYSKYILTGNFICKFLDYYTQVNKSESDVYQRLETDAKFTTNTYFGESTDPYLVIARRYKNIFPFNELLNTTETAQKPLGKRATELLKQKYYKYKNKYIELKNKINNI